jgi:hypothetical protein
MIDDKEVVIKQHQENYKNIILDIINNNTNTLVKEDLMSLVVRPPLDSMDVIKTKFISLAKKNKIILDIGKLEAILDDYRYNISKDYLKIIEFRVKNLEKLMKKTNVSEGEEYKFLKKELNVIDKHIKDKIKIKLNECTDKYLISSIKELLNNVTDNVYNKFSSEMIKYINKEYTKNILESIDVKLLVKDTTLINSVKESGDRFKLTLNSLLNID